MKNTINRFLLASLVFSFLGLSNLYAHKLDVAESQRNMNASHESYRNDRHYLMPHSLHMDGKQLYVKFQDNFYPINHLHTDPQGFYVESTELVDSGILAYCINGHPNPPWNLVCSVCREPLY